MNHTAIQEQLFALYDGELTGATRRVVEDHVAGCAECRVLQAQWKQAAGVFFQSPDVSPSEAFVERVMRRIATPSSRPSPLSRWLRESGWLVPAIGLAALLFVMVRGPVSHPVSVEALLLSDGQEPMALQRVLTDERSSPEDVLGLLIEEAS